MGKVMDDVTRLRFERNVLKAEVTRLTAETEQQRGELGELRKAINRLTCAVLHEPPSVTESVTDCDQGKREEGGDG